MSETGSGARDGDASASMPFDAGPPVDASAYHLLNLNNALCLPMVLSIDGGEAACRVLLDGVEGGGCNEPGLLPATVADIAATNWELHTQGTAPPAGAVCVLDQHLPSLVGAGCSDEGTSGWCYVQGSCSADAGQKCAQSICTTSAFDMNPPTHVFPWLTCP
jgi:hypothetical protein